MKIQTSEFLSALSDSKDVTGGGSAAALNAAIAASLVHKVMDNEYRQDRQQDQADQFKSRMADLLDIQESCQTLIHRDPAALQGLIDAYKMPKTSQDELESRQARIQESIEQAARPQVEILEHLIKVTEHQQFLVTLGPKGDIVTNLAESILFANAAFKVAHIGARTNYKALEIEDKRQERLDYVNQLLTLGIDRLALAYEQVDAYLADKKWSN